MSKILCPVDFSETSLNAIEFATFIAEKNHSVLKLLYVFTEQEFNTIVDLDSVSRSYKELIALAEEKLNVISEEVVCEGEKDGLPGCETEIDLGELKESIVRHANSGEYEMVVMGTTGLGKSLFIGSNTSAIVQKSDIPVLCVPRDASYDGFRRIIYATDIVEEDKVKLQDVISLASQFDSMITVLHLNEYHNMVEKTVINDFFDELRSFLRYANIRFDSIDYSGSLSEGLLNYMDSNSGDLLVVYSRHRNYLQNILHKSVSRKLSVVSQKPVLVLK